MKTMTNALSEICRKYGLRINQDKTRVMRFGRTDTMEVQGEEIKNIAKVKFLGSTVTSQGDSMTEIKTRLAMSRPSATKINRIWNATKLSISLKKKLVRSIIWTIATYG
ncbi:hypothetical protein CAPTEDRAFT_146177 [Capitella teleta]|uniref:Reverse transcriptase domain-containing protein n=1 Tax=Capitella teleta TaxID=283909 RepID=R7VGH9_CAPTE|nr:hypothetical protein CAPTEDRAFT_146177 [Capitella teleta]|eukprot:ELU17699.1 hypothetical protein CAPTEDRAFT_146177 [Capitella teleta]